MRNPFRRLLPALVLPLAFVACDSSTGPRDGGTVSIMLTDAPGDFQHAIVTISRIELLRDAEDDPDPRLLLIQRSPSLSIHAGNGENILAPSIAPLPQPGEAIASNVNWIPAPTHCGRYPCAPAACSICSQNTGASQSAQTNPDQIVNPSAATGVSSSARARCVTPASTRP